MTDAMIIPKDYPKVLWAIIGLNLQVFHLSRQISQIRKKIFNEAFMKKNFGQVHKQQLKEEIQYMGYPDSGNNLYSDKLSYSDWYNFNVLQQLHQDWLAALPIVSLSSACAGLVKPTYGMGVGFAYIIGRYMHSFFYRRNRKNKNIGAIIGKIIIYLSTATGLALFLRQFIKK